MKLKVLLFILATCITSALLSNLSLANGCENNKECMIEQAIKAAQENRIKDPSSPVYSCMLSGWEAKIDEEKSDVNQKKEVYNVYAYERFLACYNSKSRTGAPGEIGVETEKRKIPNGTRFRAEVICENNNCIATWKDSDCCYDLNLEKY